MITEKNESNISLQNINWECKFDGRKLNSKWNNDKCQCGCKNPKEHYLCEKRLYLESSYM